MNGKIAGIACMPDEKRGGASQGWPETMESNGEKEPDQKESGAVVHEVGWKWDGTKMGKNGATKTERLFETKRKKGKKGKGIFTV